jgi:hypothetical protein
MESILVILCIVFFTVLTYGLIQGLNMNKFHKHNCRTLYIPETMDLEGAINSIKGLHSDGLKRRALEVGATHDYVDTVSDIDLKVFIIQNSLSEEHVLFKDLRKDVETRDLIPKRDYCRAMLRNGTRIPSCPEISKPNIEKPTLEDYNKVVLPVPKIVSDMKHILITDPFTYIRHMREDMDDYENKKYSLLI